MKRVTISKQTMEAIGGLRVSVKILLCEGGDDRDWTPGRVLIRDAVDGAYICAIKGSFSTITVAEVVKSVAEYIRG